ncbi:MAG TPA: oligosaccharide flippase family protein [Ktedonobacteraceae bacterium]|nr:oligosaccharide flippase family protein [Ktedonobacteraceae bacterium]
MSNYPAQSSESLSRRPLRRTQFRRIAELFDTEGDTVIVPEFTLKARSLPLSEGPQEGRVQEVSPQPDEEGYQRNTSRMLMVDLDLNAQGEQNFSSWLSDHEVDTPPAQFAPHIEHIPTMHVPAVKPSGDLHTNGQLQWEPGTFGFDVKETGGFDVKEAAFEKRSTLPMMVLGSIAESTQQKKPARDSMQSEVSGAASAAGMVGLGNILGTLFKYVAVFLVQYGFGAGLYGLYTLSTSLINLISSVFNLGLDDAMVRYTAIYRSKKSHTSLVGLTIFCTAMAGIAGIVGALLLVFFTPAFAALNAAKHQGAGQQNSFEQVIPLLQMMAPLIPLFCMQVIWVGGLRGFKAFKWRVLTANIVQPVVQIALLLGVLFFFRNIAGVAIALLISTLASVVFNLYFLFREVSRVAPPENEQYEVREWLTFASFNFLTTIIDTVLDSIDTILLAAFGVPKAQIGQYGAAIRLNLFISLPLVSLNNIFAPTIAELHSKGKRQELEAMFKIVTKWCITFSLPIFLVIVLFSPYVLGLSGPTFVGAWPLAIAFALGGLVNAATGAVGYMLLMTGYQKLSFLNSMVSVVVNVALGVVLTPRYGAMGTAISTGMAIVVLNLMRLLQVWILLRMHPYRWDMLKSVGSGIISSAVVGAGLLLLSHEHVKTYFTLGHAIISLQLSLIPVFLACYILLLVLFKGSPEDEIVMKSLRKKFLGSKKNRQK